MWEVVRVGSVSARQLGSTNLERINDKIKKEIPKYKLFPNEPDEGNCQEHAVKVIKELDLDTDELPEKDGVRLGLRKK